jgi:hypothetical protein
MNVKPTRDLKEAVATLVKYALRTHPDDGMKLSFDWMEINDVPVGGWTITVTKNQ